jgi:hypothetical protein
MDGPAVLKYFVPIPAGHILETITISTTFDGFPVITVHHLRDEYILLLFYTNSEQELVPDFKKVYCPLCEEFFVMKHRIANVDQHLRTKGQ